MPAAANKKTQQQPSAKTIRGHFGPTIVDKQVQLVNVMIDVPEEAAAQIESDVNEETGLKQFSLKVNRDIIELAEEVTNGLIISRGLKEPQGLTMGDVLVLYLVQQRPELDGMEVLAEARSHYETWRKEASLHGMIVAMTDENELLNQATPYPDDFGQPSKKKAPSWRERIPHLPQPERKLTNVYEQRLKQVTDFLELAGAEFSTRFYAIVNNNVAKVVREVAAEADRAGFQPGKTDRAVPGTAGSAGGDSGKSTE